MSPERPSVSFFSWALRAPDFPSNSSRHLAISSSDLLFSSCWRFLVEAWTWSIFFSTCLGSSRASLSSKSVPFSMMTCSSSPSPIVKLVAAFLPFCALILSTSSLAREVIASTISSSDSSSALILVLVVLLGLDPLVEIVLQLLDRHIALLLELDHSVVVLRRRLGEILLARVL